MSCSSEAKEVLMIYASSHGVRREDIVNYAKGLSGTVSQDFILEKAIKVEEFEKSHTKEHGVEAYRDAVRLFGILYAGCNTLEALEAQGLEAGNLEAGAFLHGFYDTITSNMAILAFTTWYIATFFIKIAFRPRKDKFGNDLGNETSVAYLIGKEVVNRAGQTADLIVYQSAGAANNLGTQFISWTGVVTTLIVLPLTILALATWRK